MAFSRRLRRWVSGWLLLATLFMQLAVAAHACAAFDRAASQVPAATAQTPDCHGMTVATEPSESRLCHSHCVGDTQPRPVLADLQPDPASVRVLVRVVEPAWARDLPLVLDRSLANGPPADPLPLYLALHVLRN